MKTLGAEVTVKDRNGNDVDVREYIERIFDEREKALEQRFQSFETAINLATKNLEHRLGRFVEQDRRLDSLESRMVWMFGIGSLLIALAGLIGFAVGVVR